MGFFIFVKRGKEEQMKDHYTTVFSNQQGIVARVCSGGVVSLSIGHTSVTLQKTDFLRLAQVIRGAESRVGRRQDIYPGEARH
jgi:hypothetical protein